MASNGMELCGARLGVTTDWAISDFRALSSTYSAGQRLRRILCACGEHVLFLVVYPNGMVEEDTGYLAIYIQRDDDIDDEIYLNGSIELLDQDGERLFGFPWCQTFDDKDALSPGESIGFKRFVENKDLEKGRILCKDGTLRIHLRLEPQFRSLPKIEIAATRQEVALKQVGMQLGELLDSPIKSDVTIAAGGKEFPAHWSILCCRSKFFERMLGAGMSEAKSKYVEIHDVDALTMSALLRFLYTGDIPEESVVISPVGRWHYDSDLSYDIEDTDEGLTWSERVWSEGCKTGCISGRLHVVASNSWTSSLSNGDEINLTLQSGRMKCVLTRKSDPGSPNVTQARCSSALEFWGRLLSVAEKYCISGLSDFCENALKEHLAVDGVGSAAMILRIADETHRWGLKSLVLKTITSSESLMRAIQRTHFFDSLNADLVREVYEVYFNPRRSLKRSRSDASQGSFEFPQDSNWARFPSADLRRACTERDLPTNGGRNSLIALLESQNSCASSTAT